MEIVKSPGVGSKWPAIVGEEVCILAEKTWWQEWKTPEKVVLSVRKQSLPTKYEFKPRPHSKTYLHKLVNRHTNQRAHWWVRPVI